MPRPRKPESEKLVPVTVYIRPSRYDALEKEARDSETDLSTFLRRKLDPPVSLQQNHKPA